MRSDVHAGRDRPDTPLQKQARSDFVLLALLIGLAERVSTLKQYQEDSRCYVR
jgi:hypothetical protein